MSHSVRKSYHSANACCRSERPNKIIWHQRWRSKERMQLNILSLETIEAYQTIEKHEVSSTWDMGKDGKHYFAKHRRTILATKFANKLGRSPQERKALKNRMLHKWMGK